LKIGRVVGRAVMSHINPNLKGQKLLVIQPVDYELKPKGKPYISIDSVGAGFGEFVFLVTSAESSIPFKPLKVPADYCIVGIIDELSLLRKKNEKIRFFEHMKKINPSFAGMIKNVSKNKKRKKL
jgi:microcompartment protein CcmK/EutM